MIKTLKQTISNIYYWIKKKLIQFKKWLILIIFGASVVAAPLALPADTALINVQKDYNVSQLKDNYRLEKTAFIMDAVDENAIQAEVGNKSLDSFEPSLMLRKWDDEVNFKVKYKKPVERRLSGRLKNLIVKDKVDLEGSKIKFKSDKTEVHFYEMKKGEVLIGEELENDVYEVEVLLLEKPDTNIVEFDIETKGLAFYYQPELTQEEKDKGAFRPENVIGSYAVYHESKQGDYSKMGLKNYRAGKAFHIYRPKIIDSAGTEVWGELNITDNLLTVTIPQYFLDNAVYPIRHAAGLTFGYESVGETNGGFLSSYMYGLLATSGAAGNADNIKLYTRVAHSVKCGLYLDSDDSLVALSAGTNTVVDDWTTFLLNSEEILASNNYYVCAKSNDSTGTAIKYDSCSACGAYVQNNWPDPITWTSTYNQRWSIYCTYTAGEAEARRMFLTQ